MQSKDLTRTSRKMSRILRHDPQSAGVSMRGDGTVSINDLAKALEVSVAVVREIVATDEKSRYVILGERIWAAQGHSIDVTVPLDVVEEVPLGRLYHGTKTHNLDSIRVGGIISGDRQWVHLSGDVETALQVANRRKGVSAILTVDAEAMLAAGHKIFRSSNGVYLVSEVLPKFITQTSIRDLFEREQARIRDLSESFVVSPQ